MKIETNAVKIGFGEFLELIHQRNRDPFHEVLETLTEVAEVAYDTHPSSYGESAGRGITWSEEGIQFAFAEVA